MHQLSSKLKPFQYLVLALCLPIIYGCSRVIILNWDKGPIQWSHLTNNIIYVLVSVILIFLVRRLKNIKFDENSISIGSKKNAEIIPYENILAVKMIMAEMAGVDFYKIIYKNSEGATKSVRFLPTGNFQGFIILLKEKNKDVELSNWASSFEI